MKKTKSKVRISKEVPDLRNSEFDEEPAWVAEDSGCLLLQETSRSTNGKPWDLAERSARFGEAIVVFARTVPRHPANDRLINQIVGAGTSVGANYCEANESVSQKDFLFSVSRCVKEAKETRFFLRMVVASEPHLAVTARPLWIEATELLRIFAAMRKRPRHP